MKPKNLANIKEMLRSNNKTQVKKAIEILRTTKPTGAANLLRNVIANANDKEIEKAATLALLEVLFAK